MYAVIKAAGKQYKVSEGDIIEIDRQAGEAGEKITFGDVIALGGDKPQIGAPLVKGASVMAEVVANYRGETVIVFKKKRRHNYRRRNGHRQYLTAVKITGIKGAGKAAKEETAATA